MREPLILSIEPIKVKVKSLKELKDMGISDGAYLIQGELYNKEFTVHTLAYDPADRGSHGGTFYSGWKLHDDVHFNIETIDVTLEDLQELYPECFI